MLRERLIQLGFVVVALAAVGAGALLQGPIERQQTQHRLITATADEQVAKDPTVTLLRVAPGGFRAVAFNYLWARSENLKQEGKVYDAMQLRQLICQMMPHFPGVWGYMSWDMAWNISSSRHTPDERWMWVNNGVRLLRDQGLYYNPDDLLLYKQLAYIFYEKMGRYLDEMHMVYKERWAQEIDWVLGSPPGGATEEAIAHFAQVAEAPDTLDALAADPAAAAFLARAAEAKAAVDGSMLRYYNRFSDDPLAGRLSPEPTDPAEGENEIARLMADASLAAGRARTIAFLRKKVLREQYRMNPAWMLALMKQYGPFDWRNVNANAAYWASLGLHRALKLDLAEIHPGQAAAAAGAFDAKAAAAESVADLMAQGVDISEYNRITTERYVLFALRSMSQTGQLYFIVRDDPSAPSGKSVGMDWGPDYRFVEAVHREYLAGGKALVGPNRGVDWETNLLRDGHITYLSSAVQMLYISGQVEAAQHYLDEMNRLLKPDQEVYQKDLESFVRETIAAEGLPVPDVSRAFWVGALARVYRALADGDADEAGRARAFAKRVYDLYTTSMAGIPRNRVPPFPEQEKNFLITLMTQEHAVGMTMRDPILTKSRIYRGLSPEYQRAVYPEISTALRPQAARQNIDFDKAFPAPEAYVPPKTPGG